MYVRMAVAAILSISLLSAAAAKPKPKPPAELVSAKAAFAAAVSANKIADAIALTSFPLKNRVYKEPPTVSKASFPTLFAEYRHMPACIKTAPLEFEKGEWVVDCDGNLLRFGLRKGRWLHTEHENVNE